MRGVWLVVLALSCATLWSFVRDDPSPPAGAGEPVVAANADAIALAAAAAAPERDATAAWEREGIERVRDTADAPNARSSEHPQPTTVHGRVLLANREPAAGAEVRAGEASARADDDGGFALVVRATDADLVVWTAGQQPAVVAGVAHHPEVVAGRAIEIVLAGPPLCIDGWLRLADGSPATGWHLLLHGGTLPTGDGGLPSASAEDFAAGAAVQHADPMSPLPRRYHPNELTLDDNGAFTMRGLRSGATYTLRAWNESTLQTAVSAPIPAGTSGYLFVVPPGTWRERVWGRVIGRDGGPCGDVRVRLSMRVHRHRGGESYATGQEVRTDAQGRFGFVHVPHQDLLLRLDGEDVIAKYHELPSHDAATELLIQLQSVCRIQCLRGAASPAVDALRVLDASGADLRVLSQVGPGHTRGGRRTPWSGEQASIELKVSDAAVWLVFESDRVEVARVALSLRRGELQVVRLGS